jgi:hypothetical protein
MKHFYTNKALIKKKLKKNIFFLFSILTAQHILNFVVVCFYCKDEESCDDVQDVDIRGGFAWIKSCSKCLEKARLDRDKLEPYFNKSKKHDEV